MMTIEETAAMAFGRGEEDLEGGSTLVPSLGASQSSSSFNSPSLRLFFLSGLPGMTAPPDELALRLLSKETAHTTQTIRRILSWFLPVMTTTLTTIPRMFLQKLGPT